MADPRVNLDDIMLGRVPEKDISGHHLANAITSTCVALQYARTRTQAMSCWHALRLLLEAKFGPKVEPR